MSSQFFGLTIAASGLTTYQASLNTSANNIANVQTKGYSKQQAMTQAAEALRVNAKYGTTGCGVETTAIKQIRDVYYDTKYWQNNSKLGLYERRLYYTQQIETAFADGDDKTTGFSSLMNKLFNNMETLKGNPADNDVRTTVISAAQNLCDYFNNMSETLTNMQESCNEEIESTVSNINAISQKVAILNKQINVVELTGGYANELRDQRALLVDELSNIVPTEVEEIKVQNSNDPDEYTGATNYRVKINGQLLVDTFEYRTLECVARDERVNQCDVDGLYDIRWSDVKTNFNASGATTTGTLKALFDVRDGNNEEPFKGTVSSATSGSVTIKNPSQKEIDEMTISEKGVLTINNKEYTYSSFTREVDTAGDVSYTFSLQNPITNVEAGSLVAMQAQMGDSIDFMGIPYFQSQLNTFVRSFCEKFNTIEQGGEDKDAVDGNGDPMGMFFTGRNNTGIGEDYEFGSDDVSDASDTYYKLTAGNLQVNPDLLANASKMSTATKEEWTNGQGDSSTIVAELQTLKSDVTVFRGNSADSFLKCLISDISISTQESDIFYTNYSNISDTIINQRLSVSGVDEDEEALDLVKFQNAYNLSSRMIQTLTEIYDRLILQTGV